MEEIWQRILRHRGEVFYLKKGKAFTYSERNGYIYIDNVKSYSISQGNFQKVKEQGNKERFKEYFGIVAASYTWAILVDPRIGAWD